MSLFNLQVILYFTYRHFDLLANITHQLVFGIVFEFANSFLSFHSTHFYVHFFCWGGKVCVPINQNVSYCNGNRLGLKEACDLNVHWIFHSTGEMKNSTIWNHQISVENISQINTWIKQLKNVLCPSCFLHCFGTLIYIISSCPLCSGLMASDGKKKKSNHFHFLL